MKKIKVIIILIVFLILAFLSYLILSQKKEIPFVLGTFTELPNEIDGGSCLFSWTQEDLEKNKYAFAEDWVAYGFMRINNNLEKLDKNDETYSNEKYDVKLKVTSNKFTGEETSYVEGILIISSKIDKKSNSVERNIVGYCGA